MSGAKRWLAMALTSLGCSAAPRSPPIAPESPRAVPGESTRAIAIVRIRAPWYAPRFAIVSRFRDAVPEYERVPNLESKYFTLTDDRLFGGIYVWRSPEDAASYYNAAWREGVRKRRGVSADVVLLDVPFVLEGGAPLPGDPIGERGLGASATSALVVWHVRDARAASSLATKLATSWSSNLVKAYVVTAGPNRLGFVGVWPAQCDASRSTDDARLAALAAEFGGTSPEVTVFDTPVVIDAGIRRAGK
jgi:hypothetical protein